MSKKEQRLDENCLDVQRRDFLRGSIATTGIAVIAATGNATASVTEEVATVAPEKKEGYRLTKHIADYYKSAAI